MGMNFNRLIRKKNEGFSSRLPALSPLCVCDLTNMAGTNCTDNCCGYSPFIRTSYVALGVNFDWLFLSKLAYFTIGTTMDKEYTGSKRRHIGKIKGGGGTD